MKNIHIPLSNLNYTQKLMAYAVNCNNILDERALHSDGTIEYREPMEPCVGDEITVRLRCAKNNTDRAYLCYEDYEVPMVVHKKDEFFEYYEAKFRAKDELMRYYFKIEAGILTVYYNKKGTMREPDHYFDYKVRAGFRTPDWAKGAVMYQIFVDRFNNGDKSNDVEDNEYIYIGKKTKKVKDWNKLPDADGIREFYGGDLQGVIDKLDYLKELGVDVIYLNPVFVSPSNHKYDTQDYDYIDPHYGVIENDGGKVLKEEDDDNICATKYIKRVTDIKNLEASNKLLQNLVELAHKKNMKVILDGVFNHCGSFNKWLDKEKIYENSGKYPKGAFSDAKSPYSNYFHFYQKNSWPDNPYYDGWWGHDTLPKLNYEGSIKLHDEILKIAQKWVSEPYNIDGWRLDVAADLGYTKDYNHKFWREFRNAVKQANPNAIILAEHYGDPSDWLIEGDQWDTVMNYDAFMEPVGWFLTGMEKHSEEFRADLLGNPDAFFGNMRYNMARFHEQSLMVAMNELSNHDHSRFLTRTNNQVGRTHTVGAEAADKNVNLGIMKEAVVIQMTWIGAPTIYYGDEAGLCGWTDPDNRRTYPWGNENKDLLALHKTLISIRNSLDVIKTGSIKFLLGEYNLISYARFNSKQKVIVVINNNNEEREAIIPVWRIGITNNEDCVRIFESTEDGFNTSAIKYNVIKGKIRVAIKKFSGIIIKQV